MWRSSQPKSGVSGASVADEKLLDLIAQSCVYKRTPTGGVKVIGDPLLCIVDCRPKVCLHFLPIAPQCLLFTSISTNLLAHYLDMHTKPRPVFRPFSLIKLTLASSFKCTTPHIHHTCRSTLTLK